MIPRHHGFTLPVGKNTLGGLLADSGDQKEDES